MTHPQPAPPHTREADRRAAARTECFLEIAVSGAGTAFLEARVLDLSAGGVKLQVDPAPAPGDEVRLTFLTHEGQLFRIPATALHYVEEGEAWAVGCRFARELDEKEMAALL